MVSKGPPSNSEAPCAVCQQESAEVMGSISVNCQNRQKNKEKRQMKGEAVVVRAFQGEPLICRVWEATAEKVYVCSEDNFAQLSAGDEGRSPVGVPREDVFCYDNTAINVVMQMWESDPSIWDRL